MDLSEVTERISRKMESRGITPDRKRIDAKLHRLVDEFGVHVSEAERTVMNELAREHSLTGMGTRSTELREIRDLVVGEWVSLQGKIVALMAAPSPAIAQTGIIADPSGAIRFVVWARANLPVMEAGKWYRLESAVVDEYKGVPKLNVHGGTTITPAETDMPLIPAVVPVKDLVPGVASVRVKVVQEWEVTHERMLQSGLLGDETGTVKFIIWKEEGKEKLVPGAVYHLYYALVDEFNGRLSLNLSPATCIPEEGDIQVASGQTFRGVLIHAAPGSGLVKRCPVEGCNRVLSRQNYCPVHEIQKEFRYDLRIKGVLDDGTMTKNVLIQRELVEELAGITLAEAQQLAESNPLGMDEVFLRIRDAVQGRYYAMTGNEFDGRILVRQASRIAFDPMELAGLLNRAGGEAQ